MTNFIRSSNPIWWIPDLTGFPLNDEYYAFFLTNDLPYVPQAVYQDVNGNNPWPDPLQFQPAGTLPNNLYFDETKTYRIEIRHGNTSADELIYLIENFVPGNNVNSSNSSLLTAENMITNPQFVDVYFQSPFVYTQSVSGNYTIDIAPGWRIDLVGTGTLTLNQGTLAGDSHTVGNPNYYLHIQNTGWTTVKLVQRFSNNGAIFGNGAIAIAFTAVATGVSPTVSTEYKPSTGTTIQMSSDVIALGNFAEYKRAVTVMPQSGNSQSDGAAFVDLVFNIPIGSDLSFTNIQFVGQKDNLPSSFNELTDAPVFQQLTYERTVDHEFNVYKNSLVTQPKDSLLAGWNFSLNPWQFRDPALDDVSNTEFYTADQTIVLQQNVVNTNTGINVSVGRGSAAQNYAFTVSASTATNKFALIQYIDTKTIRPYWGQNLSVMVNANVVTTHTTQPKFKVRLIWRSTAVPIISQLEPISAWLPGNSPGNEPTFATGWTPILPLKVVSGLTNDSEATLSTTATNFSFNQFKLPAAITDTMYLGIVIYTTTELDSTGTADSILFNRISLVPNDFAIDVNTETFDESLRKCQEYYEKSYDVSFIPGTVAINYAGASSVLSNANAQLYGIERPFKVEKIRTPFVATFGTLVTWYSPESGTANVVKQIGGGDIAIVAGNTYASTKSTGIPTIGAPAAAFFAAQWTADSRLGKF